MEATLAVLNQMEQEGVIGRYAIGGAVGAMRYIEAFHTNDLDVFVALPEQGGLVTLEPIYQWLKAKGYAPKMEGINIEGWEVQFLPIPDGLHEEAVKLAEQIPFGQTQARVMKAEHLAAMMVGTGRTKDLARLEEFLKPGVLDLKSLTEIIQRFGLGLKWQAISSRMKLK